MGTPDIIVNNAGAGQWKFVDETTPEEAVQMMAVPYFATFYVTHAFYRACFAAIPVISSTSARSAPVRLARRDGLYRGPVGGARIYGGAAGGSGRHRHRRHAVRIRGRPVPYWDHNPGSRERVPKMGRLVPELTPRRRRAIVHGIEREQKLVVVPFMMKLTYWQHAVFPGVVQWLMTRTGYTRPRARSEERRPELAATATVSATVSPGKTGHFGVGNGHDAR